MVDLPSHHLSESGVPFSQPIAQPRLREEDECPICHGALPPRGANGSEIAREEHVEACIGAHFSASTPRALRPSPSQATGAAIHANAVMPSHTGERPITSGHRLSGRTENAQAVTFQQRRMTGGMLQYLSTEKDCVGDNGVGEAECVICFEEFAVGVEMGRLECLCKFHKVSICYSQYRRPIITDWQACIQQWWNTKGHGACPVHQEVT